MPSAFALLVVINGTLNAICRGAVSLCAEKGEVAPQFGRPRIEHAFGPKR